MEAGLVRVPTIASPTNAFQHAIQSGYNGFLANNEEEWIKNLSKLVEQPDFRIALGERAYAHILQKYHPTARAVELVQILDEIQNRVTGTTFQLSLSQEQLHRPQATQPDEQPIQYLPPELELRPTLLQMAFYALRHRGLKTMLMQVWIYFRRGIAFFIPYRKATD